MGKKWRWTLAFGCALCASAIMVFGGLPAVADDVEPPSELAEDTPASDIPVSVGGMTVWIDAETGQLRQPTAEEAAALSAAMHEMFRAPAAAAAAPAAGFALDGGGVGIDLGLSQLDFSVATVEADGTVAFKCLDSGHEAAAHVHGPSETTTASVEDR